MKMSSWFHLARVAVPSAVLLSTARTAALGLVDYVADDALESVGLQRRESNVGLVVGSFVVGAVAAVTACLFLAPHGQEMREELWLRARALRPAAPRQPEGSSSVMSEGHPEGDDVHPAGTI